MKMDFLNSEAAQDSIIRLYCFSTDEIKQFCHLLNSLATSAISSSALHEQPFIQSINECRLTLRNGKRDGGIEIAADGSFECVLTPIGWEDELERIKPFTQDDDQGRYQWLLWDAPTEVRLLLSQNGDW